MYELGRTFTLGMGKGYQIGISMINCRHTFLVFCSSQLWSFIVILLSFTDN